MTRPTSLAGLCALAWAPRYDRSAEAVAAARAWLAAIAAWRGALGLPPGSTFDVAGAVGAPELADDVRAAWSDHAARERLGDWQRLHGEWMLRWDAWVHEGGGATALDARGLGALPDPWLHLARTWELAGAIEAERGFLHVAAGSIPIGSAGARR